MSAGRAALLLFGVHLVLLFFPPIPPIVKGSLWSYLAGYGAVVLGLVELARRGGAIRGAWSRTAVRRRWAIGGALVLSVLALTVALRAAAPGLFSRFSGEEGLWEPLTVFLYLGCAVLLFGAAREQDGPGRKHWRLVGSAYALVGLEEIDYFGIFGGLIGRIEGIYVGSLHDFIHLAAEGRLSAPAWIAIGAVALALHAALWRTGYLQPRAIAAMAFSLDIVWAVFGLGFLAYAAVVEIPPFGWHGSGPTPEEALELAGAACLVLFALLRWPAAVDASRTPPPP
ncbi:MAG: hypothetical protein ACREKI_03260 [Gemmatimonadota bacterium]